MGTLKALIFDVDGTLANTESDGHLPAFNWAFKAVGLDWQWSDVLYHDLLKVSGGRERIRHYIKCFHSDKDYAHRPDLAQWIAGIHRLKTQRFIRISKSGLIPLRTGVQRLLNEAKQAGITLAIATTTSLDNVITLLRYTLGEGAIDDFAVIAAGDVVKKKKPAGDIYTYTLDKLGLLATDCLAVEDSANGILSATAAGIKSIITTNQYTNYHSFAGALLVANQLGEPSQTMTLKGGEAMGEVSPEETYITINLLKRIYAKYC